jgi:hypothetical protein
MSQTLSLAGELPLFDYNPLAWSDRRIELGREKEYGGIRLLFSEGEWFRSFSPFWD